MLARGVEVIERARDEQVGVGVEVFAELVALVAQIALDLKLDVLRAVLQVDALAQMAAELLVHHIVAQIGDVTDHARDAQAAPGHDVVCIEIAAVEIRIGDDGAARHLVEGNVLGIEVGRARHHHRVPHAVGILQRPRQRLHAPQAAAQHHGQLRNAQAVQQQGLGVDPVFHRHHRELRAIDGARVRVGVHRPGRAEARAQVVHPDHKELVGVHRLARADHVVPPALALGLVLVDARHVVRRVERVADQHGVGLVGVEFAVGLVGQRVVTDRGAARQWQRLGEMHELRCGDEGHEKTRHR
ncbi:hypothetical protein SDC9_125732 [bioreactor metagenome]|uniref:Uncharacterized protein n=1 Tax=bioreactor metagenome TaxID=1076179 RepID=A0A645CP76_9ZZZZ